MNYYRYDYLENELKISNGEITKEETLSRIAKLAVLAEQIRQEMEEAKKAIEAETVDLIFTNRSLNSLAHRLCDAGKDVGMIVEI